MSRTDPFDLSPPAQHSQVLAEAKVKSEVPDSNDAQATMEYWDEHRRKARAKLDELGIRDRADEFGCVRVGAQIIIGEFPTPEALTMKRLEEEARTRPRETRWQKFKRSLSRGISKLKGSSGARSARRTRGTKPTA